MELRLGQYAIRSWRLQDKESLVQHANDREVWINLRDAFPFPYTHLDADQWLGAATKQNPETQFAIQVAGAAIGGIGIILKGDVYRQTAEVGYWIGREFWGRGIATACIRPFTKWVFDNFPLTRLSACVFAWNGASARVLEKSGFTLEGRLRQSVIKAGKVTDELVYGLLK